MATLRQYVIEYGDGPDSGCPPMYCTISAHSANEALERFYDCDDGFIAERIAKKSDKPRHTWKWRAC